MAWFCSLKSVDALLSHSNFQEKAPYEAKAAKRKAEYEKLMTAYLKKQVNASLLYAPTLNLIVRMLAWSVSQSPVSFDLKESSSDEDDEGSEKSASEVHDDEQVWLPTYYYVSNNSVCMQ